MLMVRQQDQPGGPPFASFFDLLGYRNRQLLLGRLRFALRLLALLRRIYSRANQQCEFFES
jgi:hypothetical protein